jgi:hypothetical protein
MRHQENFGEAHLSAETGWSLSSQAPPAVRSIQGFPQRTFYGSFAADGAFDCGPAPNARF